MTFPLLLTGGFILLTCWLWHRALVAQHQQMEAWKRRNKLDVDDWMPPEEGGEE